MSDPDSPDKLTLARKRTEVLTCFKRALLYSLAFSLLFSLGSGSLWFLQSYIYFALHAFTCAVVAIPLFLNGHLIVRSNSHVETICRGSIAGIALGMSLWDFLHVSQFLYWSSLYDLSFFRWLNQGTNYWACNILLALLAEVLAAFSWRKLWHLRTMYRESVSSNFSHDKQRGTMACTRSTA